MLSLGRTLIRARLAAMDERGASAAEYGLLLAGIVAAIVVVVLALGGTLSGIFQDADGAIAP